MNRNIECFIGEIKELRNLYQTDNIFNECIKYAVASDMSIQDALILAILKGYESKQKETSQEKQKRLNCYTSNGCNNWNCYNDCALWDDEKKYCTKLE